MNKLIAIFLISLSSLAFSECDFNFTVEQDKLLNQAYIMGFDDDIGYALASIVWKESFVGEYVIRVNNTDGKYGSYGVTHVLLTTAMHMLGYENSRMARAELVPRMMSDDVFMLWLSLDYLKQHQKLGYRKMISRYNGKGPRAEAYANDVIKRVHKLEHCEYFKELSLL